MGDTPLLFTPLRLAGLTARNRVVVSPMCQYSSERGGPTDWHLVHLGKFALGGAGIVFCEETAVEERARKTYGCAGIYDDRHISMYRRITDFLRNHGSIPAMQLGHSGRKASCGPPWTNFTPLTTKDAKEGRVPWHGVSASAIPPREGAPAPVELSTAEIKMVVARWREAALRTLEAGFDILEIHGAHGYLVHQFLSPLANRRTDAYGGDLAGRMRFALEVTEAVRAAWPRGKPLFFRVSAVDGDGGAWGMDDTVVLARELRTRGVDVVTCSSGGISGPLNMAIVPRVPGYQVLYAERVRREAGLMTCAVGLITEARQAEDVLQRGQADLIALARELLYNPNWPVHAARELGVPDYLDLLPPAYAWWLKRREKIREISSPAAVGAASDKR
ncbi:MAG: NADH:flavin oxidoreductase/NADH oxidase [Betaproteobacteria bacterium]|nr:NADH:flavin oxidoreductase/NADH oxidase [Betaproteobacteria bacterium]